MSIESIYISDIKSAKELEANMNIKEFEFFKSWAIVNQKEHSKMRLYMLIKEIQKTITNFRLFSLPSNVDHVKYITSIECELESAKMQICSDIIPSFGVKMDCDKNLL
jgi:hypothetical protein